MKYLLLAFFLFPGILLAQSTTEEEFQPRTFCFGIVPQYAISNGLRFDLDFKLNDKNHWLVVAPQMYISSESSYNWDYNSMVGAGIELQHRIYLIKKTTKSNAYFAYGPVFNYFSVNDDGLVERQFTESGGNYIGLEEDEITTNIFKIGGNLIFGIQFIISNNFYVDSFIGTGIRFSFDNQTSGLHDYYNNWWGDMGYSGTLMVGGFRFGVMF